MSVLVLGAGAGWVDRLRAAVPGPRIHAAADDEDALRAAADAEVIIGLAHAIPERLLSAAPKLRWVQALTSGTDPLDRLLEPRPDVVLTNARGIHGPQMSELAFLFMLGLLRDMRGVLARQAEHRWDRRPQRLLFGRTVAILGIGAIAEELALRCKAFGMNVIGISANRAEAPHFDEVLPRSRLHDAAARADILVALVPATAETRHIIDAGVLAAMRPDSLLINIARGAVVDEVALARCLAEGGIAGAGLDVFDIEPLPPDSPLWDAPNTIITPHVGGVSDIYMDQIFPLVVKNLAIFRDEGSAGLRRMMQGSAMP